MYCTECWGPHFHWFGIVPFFFMILMFLLVAAMIRRPRNWRWGPGNRAGCMPIGCCNPGQWGTWWNQQHNGSEEQRREEEE